jgi:hypothetical protein
LHADVPRQSARATALANATVRRQSGQEAGHPADVGSFRSPSVAPRADVIATGEIVALAMSETLPRIGGIAMMPSRSHTLAAALASILPQVDRLFVFFDKSASVPAACLGHPKIEPLLPARHGELGAGGKFLGAELHAGPCLYFCFDDDILYPPTYVDVLTRGLQRYYMRAIVGLHGVLFQPPHLSYRNHRSVQNFADKLDIDVGVDALGTGTIAFHTGRFRFDQRQWPLVNVTDLMIAIEAVKQEVPRICIRRPLGFLRPLQENQADSVSQRLACDDRQATEIMRAALEAYPHAWHRWAPGKPSE